jgi:DNA repair protein RecN (Recombination protein N)
MLLELRVENLLLIDRAELRLEPGLNVMTGETGAGKTVLAHALDLLLGGKPRPGIVRPGASEAYVEGVFAIPDGLFDGDALADLRERMPEDADEIVLGRRVGAEGRTRAFVQGRSASAADLRELGGRLLSCAREPARETATATCSRSSSTRSRASRPTSRRSGRC